MKFRKLRHLALATFAFCGLTLGSHMTAIASDTTTDSTPETVTMKLHKLDNIGVGDTPQNKDREDIKNTGDEVEIPKSMSPYNADQYGKVTFSVYDISELFADKDGNKVQMTSEQFKTKRDALIEKITAGKTDPEELIATQKQFATEHNLSPIDTQELEGTDGILTFDKLPNSGFYLIMETEVPAHHLTGISAPMIIGLPLSDKDTIHLYPKNIVARDVDPEIHKVGINPLAPLSKKHVALEGVVFELREEGSDKVLKELRTDSKGNIEFGGLTVGTNYVLTEHSIKNYPWYEQPEGRDIKISLTFTVDKVGNVEVVSAQPDKKFFKVKGSWIGIVNHLILGGAKFEKVDANSGKGLAGAKFKVQSLGKNGTSWAVFKNNQFEKWVKNKANATELTSTADGTFSFTGLPYVYDEKVRGVTQYNLVETQAPAGYALVEDVIAFDITNDKDATEVKAQTIKNERYALPITGGMGIWLFLLIGSLLVGGAGYLYYRQRKAA